MPRIYDLKGLGILNKTVSDKTKAVRAHRAVLESELKDLDTQDAQRKFTPQYIREKKANVRAETLKQVRNLNTELDELTSQARRERHTWSRESLLADQYADTNSSDKQTRLLESLTSSIRRMELSARLPRLKDDQLTSFAEQAAESGDGMAVILASEEGQIRGSVVGMRCKKLLDSLPCSQAETAGEIYSELTDHLNEAESIEKLVQYPDDKIAHAQLRVREIKLGSGQDADKTEDTAEQTQPTQQPENGDSEPAADGLNGGVSIVNPTNT